MKPLTLVLILVLAACTQEAAAQADSLRAQAEQQVLEEQQETIARIVQGVARGVLYLPAGAEPTRDQEETIARITRSLVDDMAVFRAEEQKQNERTQKRNELFTSVVLNVAKGIAVVIALLVLKAIIGAIGRGVAAEEVEGFGGTVSVLISTASEAEAETIGRALIDDHLAAVGTIASPIRTIAHREGRIADTTEALLVLKTTQANVPAIIGHVAERTDVSLPEVITLPRASGQDPDLDWVRKPESKSWWNRIWRPGGKNT